MLPSTGSGPSWTQRGSPTKKAVWTLPCRLTAAGAQVPEPHIFIQALPTLFTERENSLAGKKLYKLFIRSAFHYKNFLHSILPFPGIFLLISLNFMVENKYEAPTFPSKLNNDIVNLRQTALLHNLFSQKCVKLLLSSTWKETPFLCVIYGYLLYKLWNTIVTSLKV